MNRISTNKKKRTKTKKTAIILKEMGMKPGNKVALKPGIYK